MEKNKSQELDLENLYSLYTSRFALLTSKMHLGAKYYDTESPQTIIDDILAKAEEEWARKSAKYAKQENMKKATMRMILKHAKEDFAAHCKDDYNKLVSFEVENDSMENWFAGLHAAFDYLSANLGKCMSEVTGYPWQNKWLVVKEGGHKKVINIAVPSRDDDEETFFDKAHDYEEIMYDYAGNAMSLQNFLEQEIRERRLVIAGEKLPTEFDKNFIKLHSSYIDALPKISVPIKDADLDLIALMSTRFPAAQKELSRLKHYGKSGEGNAYFDLFPRLNDYMVELIKKEEKAIKQEKREESMLPLLDDVDHSLSMNYRKQIRDSEPVFAQRLDDFRQDKLPDTEIYLVRE